MDNVHQLDAPSPWVQRWTRLIPDGGRVLDLACGGGRHARYLAKQGYRVEAVDRDAEALASLAGVALVSPRQADLEAGDWPYAEDAFSGIVVCHYLHRPLFPAILASLAPGGVLIYETFAAGNERYGRPSNPNFLLNPGELLGVVAGRMRVVAYEDGYLAHPRQAMIQRIVAARGERALPIG